MYALKHIIIYERSPLKLSFSMSNRANSFVSLFGEKKNNDIMNKVNKRSFDL